MAGSKKALVTLHEMNPGRIDDGESSFRSRVEAVGEFGRLQEPLSRLWVWDRTFLRWSRNGRLAGMALFCYGWRDIIWGGD
jgi:hypothetical protein